MITQDFLWESNHNRCNNQSIWWVYLKHMMQAAVDHCAYFPHKIQMYSRTGTNVKGWWHWHHAYDKKYSVRWFGIEFSINVGNVCANGSFTKIHHRFTPPIHSDRTYKSQTKHLQIRKSWCMQLKCSFDWSQQRGMEDVCCCQSTWLGSQ